MPDPKMPLKQEHAQIMDKIRELYCDLFHHDGFGELKVEMKFLKKTKRDHSPVWKRLPIRAGL